jgi:hypothetical protein
MNWNGFPRPEVHLVPALCPLAVSPFDFSRSRELIERAAQSTKKWIDEGGLERRALPQELARRIAINFSIFITPVDTGNLFIGGPSKRLERTNHGPTQS